MISEEYLTRHDLDLEETIREYYRMLLHQVISDKYQYVTARDETYAFCGEVAERFGEIIFFDKFEGGFVCYTSSDT